MTLDAIAAPEDLLLSRIPPHGYFEERGPQVEAAGLPERWQEVFAAYIELVGHEDAGREALARAVFIAWYSFNEPWQLTGIRDLPLAQVAEVLKELDSLNSFLASIEGSYSPDTPLRQMEGRGALGDYWLSRNDVTFR